MALSIVSGRRIAIRPKRQDDWTVVSNLWGAVIGRPGVMKTPALTEAIKPVRRLEAEARNRHEGAVETFRADELMAAAQVDTAKKALKAAATAKKDKSILESLAREAAKVAALADPILRRCTTSDPTVEALGALLRDNPNGMGIVRDELPGWFRSLDKDGRECDRSFYLEPWNGNGTHFDYDRIGRGHILSLNPCVSILGGMQPGPLRSLPRRVARGDEADNGLISRFQLMVWPDTGREWRNFDRWPDTSLKNRAYAVYQALDSIDPANAGATPDEDGGPSFLRFDTEAQDLFDAWRSSLEIKLRASDEHPLIESHLAKDRSLMPSLALLFHLIDLADGAGVGQVTVRSARLAVEWCVYLEAHARRIYGSVTEPEIEFVRVLADRIKDGVLPSPFSTRDVDRRGWSGLTTPEAVNHAVMLLEALSWLQTVESRETGGAPRADIHIHPKLPRKEQPDF